MTGPRPLVVEPVRVRYLLASAALRLGVGRPLPASAAGLFFSGASGVCAPWEPWALPSVAPSLLRRNTRLCYCDAATSLHPVLVTEMSVS